MSKDGKTRKNAVCAHFFGQILFKKISERFNNFVSKWTELGHHWQPGDSICHVLFTWTETSHWTQSLVWPWDNVQEISVILEGRLCKVFILLFSKEQLLVSIFFQKLCFVGIINIAIYQKLDDTYQSPITSTWIRIFICN